MSTPAIGEVGHPSFSLRPFVVGSLTGVRMWNVDQNSRLQPSNEFPNSTWTTGENVAACHKEWAIARSAVFASTNRFLAGCNCALCAAMVGMNTPATPDPVIPEPDPNHSIASLDCVCGFYAFFDRDHVHQTYVTSASVHGLIEGYGVMTVGEQGFRASKARIKALVISAPRATEAVVRLMRNYPDIPVYGSLDSALKDHPLTRPDDVPKAVDAFSDVARAMRSTNFSVNNIPAVPTTIFGTESATPNE